MMFVFSLCCLVFVYGIAAYKYSLFPYSQIHNAWFAARTVINLVLGNKSWYYRRTGQTQVIPVHEHDRVQEGNTLVISVGSDDRLSAKVITLAGELVHEWPVDWFDIWSDATHLPDKDLPKSRPGTHIHGSVLMDNGDLVFNFEHLGLVRLDLCGNVVWRLPYRTHHSVHPDETGNLWVPGQINYTEPLAGYPNYRPPFIGPTVQCRRMTLNHHVPHSLQGN